MHRENVHKNRQLEGVPFEIGVPRSLEGDHLAMGGRNDRARDPRNFPLGSRKNWTTKNNTNHNGQAHAAPTNQVTAAVTAATNPTIDHPSRAMIITQRPVST